MWMVSNFGMMGESCACTQIFLIDMRSGGYVHISCFVWRRKCLYNILDRFCDDTGLLFSILKTGKSKHIKMIGFGYRKRDESIMHKADKLELNIVELAIYQDCYNSGGLEKSCLSRFMEAFKYVYVHRNELNKMRYKKYKDSCASFENDFLGQIAEYDKLSEAEKNFFEIIQTSVAAFL